MKFILILEDDERIQKDLFETLKNIDPKLSIRFFLSLAEFHEWLKVAVQDGPRSLAKAGLKFKDDQSEDIEPANNHELRLVIAKNEFLGTQNMGLIKRAQEFFLRKKMCSEQEPTALILTAFDSPDFDIALAEQRIINNVIFKPFDKLILKQHLEYALTGHHPVNTGTVASMNIQSTIEMLKDVSIHSLSEVGFTTLNNHEIKIGAMTKYYSEAFKTNNKKSVYAFCKSCKELSDKEYLCEFLFFGIDNAQIQEIRKRLLQNKNHATHEIKNTHGVKTSVLIVDEDPTKGNDIKMFLQERISNVDVYYYSHLSQLAADLEDKDTVHRQAIPAKFDVVIAGFELFEFDKEKRWEVLCEQLKKRSESKGVIGFSVPQLILVANKKIQPDEMRNFAAWTDEIFFYPLDKGYFVKKLLYTYPNLLNKEEATINHVTESVPLKVANPVEITQISEAGLVLKYYRAISIGAFREFVLWRPEELETPEIIGTINYNEKDKNADHFLNHFVFFGMKDAYLKHIRLWLREAYIKSKEKG